MKNRLSRPLSVNEKDCVTVLKNNTFIVPSETSQTVNLCSGSDLRCTTSPIFISSIIMWDYNLGAKLVTFNEVTTMPIWNFQYKFLHLV